MHCMYDGHSIVLFFLYIYTFRPSLPIETFFCRLPFDDSNIFSILFIAKRFVAWLHINANGILIGNVTLRHGWKRSHYFEMCQIQSGHSQRRHQSNNLIIPFSCLI